MDTAQQLHLYVRETLSNALLSHAIKTSAGWTWVETIELPGEVDLMWPDHADGLRLFDAASQEETIYSRRQDETYSPLRKRIAGLDLRARKTLLNGRNALHVFGTAVVSIPGGSATPSTTSVLALTSRSLVSNSQAAMTRLARCIGVLMNLAGLPWPGRLAGKSRLPCGILASRSSR
ncbi:MAG: hypothetical protein IPM07_00840 [Anaerolineales bacterium]|nr:hypothetical protein [Anaerolineales bacterium]